MRRKQLKKPKGLSRALFRAPILLYRLGLGRLMGERVLMLIHTGRLSGQTRRTVLEVMARDEASETYYIASVWGERADWLQNLLQNPRCRVRVGKKQFESNAERVSEEVAEAVLLDYVGEHPRALRGLASFTGFEVDGSEEDYRKMARQLPIVALRPAS